MSVVAGAEAGTDDEWVNDVDGMGPCSGQMTAPYGDVINNRRHDSRKDLPP